MFCTGNIPHSPPLGLLVKTTVSVMVSEEKSPVSSLALNSTWGLCFIALGNFMTLYLLHKWKGSTTHLSGPERGQALLPSPTRPQARCNARVRPELSASSDGSLNPSGNGSGRARSQPAALPAHLLPRNPQHG